MAQGGIIRNYEEFEFLESSQEVFSLGTATHGDTHTNIAGFRWVKEAKNLILNVYLPPAWNPTFATLPSATTHSSLYIFPWSQLSVFNLSPLTETSYNDKSLSSSSSSSSSSSIMSLFALILEALAGTVTLLSAPILLDRVLTHLCASPFPFSLMLSVVLTKTLLARMLPLGAGIA